MNAEHEHIRELIEAFRPGLDSLSSPEFRLLADRLESDERLREQFGRSQQVDRALATAMQDVAIPHGLSDRLLESLTDVGPGAAGAAAAGQALVIRRRWMPWLASGAGISCVAAAICFFVFVMQPDVWTPTQFAQTAAKWTQPENVVDVWNDLDSKILADFPPRWPRRAQVRPRTWQRAGESKAVCYQLQTADNDGPAYLVVLPGRGGKGFPMTPQLIIQTAGRCVAVWAVKGHLYALVIEGSESRFRRLVPRSPTA